ncbi:MAG: prepilin-type N-terminal cleavage/methylation domain-containing protein [Planctomycetota bacterium]|jgi:prepilin-type N-terminal cleavage/methylation domain-containing protein
MKHGFTLMEVMIALAIMGMVMATVMQSVDQTRTAVDAIHNVMETENNGPLLLATIRRDLENIAIYDAADYKVLKGVNQTQIGAEADRLDLIVRNRGKVPIDLPSRMDPVFAPISEVGYRLRQNPLRPDFLELYRREDPLVDEDPFRDGTFTLLYDRVISLDLRYTAEPDYNPVWVDSWDSFERESLPFAVDIFLEIEIQPRRSLESLNILGANRARLEFEDVVHFPEETRWRFRNRIHPQRPDAGGEGDGAADGAIPNQDGSGFDGEGFENNGESVLSNGAAPRSGG